MKHTALLLIAILTITIISCGKNYRDNNGDFGGMWQLTQWQTRSSSGQIDSTIATNKDGIYYGVQRELIQFTHANDSINTYYSRYFSYFKLSSDSLIIYNVAQNNDSVVPITRLSVFGVPANGAFHVDALSNDNMVLSSDDNRLFFRKY